MMSFRAFYFGERRFILEDFEGMTQPLPQLMAFKYEQHHSTDGSANPAGHHIKLTLPSGAGFSIIKCVWSYGSEHDLWEVMLPDGKVEGHQDMAMVSELIARHANVRDDRP